MTKKDCPGCASLEILYSQEFWDLLPEKVQALLSTTTHVMASVVGPVPLLEDGTISPFLREQAEANALFIWKKSRGASGEAN